MSSLFPALVFGKKIANFIVPPRKSPEEPPKQQPSEPRPVLTPEEEAEHRRLIDIKLAKSDLYDRAKAIYLKHYIKEQIIPIHAVTDRRDQLRELVDKMITDDGVVNTEMYSDFITYLQKWSSFSIDEINRIEAKRDELRVDVSSGKLTANLPELRQFIEENGLQGEFTEEAAA